MEFSPSYPTDRIVVNHYLPMPAAAAADGAADAADAAAAAFC